METIAIILARGGSKGIPQKNIVDFCGKPLIAWTIENCLTSGLSSVFVSSDNYEILEIADTFGAKTIERPAEISGDKATSESGWLHAIKMVEENQNKIDWVLTPQVTSPLRTEKDILNGLKLAKSGVYDSLFSCSTAEDLFLWENNSGSLKSINYNWEKRKRRQILPKQYIENGSFYLFKPEILKKNNNRLGGRIGVIEMEFWKMFEIDSLDDLKMCAALMNEFIIK